MSQNTTLPLRSEVPVEQTWNLESIYPSVEAWEADLKAVREMVPAAAEFQGKLAEGPQTLLAAFKATEALYRRAMKTMVYAMLASAVDAGDQQALARAGQARSLFA